MNSLHTHSRWCKRLKLLIAVILLTCLSTIFIFDATIGGEITLDVTATTAGAKVNTTGNIGSTETGAGSDNATDTLTVNNPTLTINVVGNFGVNNIDSTTGTPSPGPINCPGGPVCSASFLLNESVTLNVTVDASSSFQGWSGDCAAFGAALSGAITMNGDKTCTATFAVSAGVGGITFVSPNGSDANDCKSPATACATIQAGIDAVIGRGTVAVLGGSYSGGITINKSVNLICQPTLFGPLSATISGGPGITIGASDVSIGGFIFENFGAGASAGVVVNSGNNVNINGNAFIGPGSDAGVHRNGGTVDATTNWWGCNSGSNTANCTNATGGADADPWLVATIDATPNPVDSGKPSDIIIDLSRNSDGELFSNKISRPVSISTSGGFLSQNGLPTVGVSFPSHMSHNQGGMATLWAVGGFFSLVLLLILTSLWLMPIRRRGLALAVVLLMLSVTLSGCSLFGLFGGGGDLLGGPQSINVTMVNGVAVVTISSPGPGNITITAQVDNETLTLMLTFTVGSLNELRKPAKMESLTLREELDVDV